MHEGITEFRHAYEVALVRIKAQHAITAHQPGLPGRRDHQRIEIGGAQRGALARRQVQQHTSTLQLALLHAAAGHRQPQRGIGRGSKMRHLPGRHRRRGIAGGPFVHRAIHAQPQQPTGMAQPHLPARILGHGRGFDAAQAVEHVGIKRPHVPVGTEILDDAIQACQPGALAVTRKSQRAIHRAVQAVLGAGDACQLAPVGAQVAQALAGNRHPQRAATFAQQGANQAGHVGAAGTHRFRQCTCHLMPQAALAGDPVIALATCGNRGHGVRAVEHWRPLRLRPRAVTVPPDAARSAHPQAIRQQRKRVHDHRAIGIRQGHATEAAAIAPREPARGSHPHLPSGIGRKRQHDVGRQAVLLRGEALPTSVRIDPGQAAVVGADPHRIALRGERPHIVTAQCGLVLLAGVLELLAGGIQHADAAAFGGHPDPILRVHQQCLHIVAGQAARIRGVMAPHPHVHAVVAGQAVGGGDPQVAGLVVRQCLDLCRRQSLRRPHQPEARAFGHAGLHANASQRAQQEQHPCETTRHISPPMGRCSQCCVADASLRLHPAVHRICA